VTLINSLQRRVEAYHSRLQIAAQSAGRVASIHEQTLAKEPGLEKRLKYDRWARNTFRLLLFAPEKTHADFEALRLEESASFAGGDYRIESVTAEEVKLAIEAPLRQVLPGIEPRCILRAEKTLRFTPNDDSFDVICRLDLVPTVPAPPPPESGAAAKFTVGMEVVLNLLAPNVADRYIEFAGNRQPLEWSGAIDGSCVRFADEWQNVAVGIKAHGAAQLWISPIETVSESEEGFERVYQGSQILCVWNVALSPTEPWSAETTLHVRAARS
jgi:alpha-amylase